MACDRLSQISDFLRTARWRGLGSAGLPCSAGLVGVAGGQLKQNRSAAPLDELLQINGDPHSTLGANLPDNTTQLQLICVAFLNLTCRKPLYDLQTFMKGSQMSPIELYQIALRERAIAETEWKTLHLRLDQNVRLFKDGSPTAFLLEPQVFSSEANFVPKTAFRKADWPSAENVGHMVSRIVEARKSVKECWENIPIESRIGLTRPIM